MFNFHYITTLCHPIFAYPFIYLAINRVTKLFVEHFLPCWFRFQIHDRFFCLSVPCTQKYVQDSTYHEHIKYPPNKHLNTFSIYKNVEICDIDRKSTAHDSHKLPGSPATQFCFSYEFLWHFGVVIFGKILVFRVHIQIIDFPYMLYVCKSMLR